MNWLRSIFNWVRALLGRERWITADVNEVPERLLGQTVYLVGEDDHPWSAALLCPCGCGETIRLSLIPDDDPSWSVTSDRHKRATLEPSIWRVRGCFSHFFVRDGKIIWAAGGKPADGRTARVRPPLIGHELSDR